LSAASTAAPAPSNCATSSMCPIIAALCRRVRPSCNQVDSSPRERQERPIRTRAAVTSAVSCARQRQSNDEGWNSCTPQTVARCRGHRVTPAEPESRGLPTNILLMPRATLQSTPPQQPLLLHSSRAFRPQWATPTPVSHATTPVSHAMFRTQSCASTSQTCNPALTSPPTAGPSEQRLPRSPIAEGVASPC
jgi:hypothetical protein